MTHRRGRRTAGLLAVLAALALLAALAAWILGNTRFELATARGEGGALTVETELPAATCRKVLTAEFPWVRFECDERSGGAAAAEPGAAPAPRARETPAPGAP